MTAQAAHSVTPYSPAASDATLRERTRLLAHIPVRPDDGRGMEVLVCRVGAEEYAIELRLLHGVFRTPGLTRVPCTPLFVAGLLNLRGEILTVLDLAAALGLPASDQHEVLLADTPRVRVGLLVQQALEVRRLALDGLDRGVGGNTFTRGIANARTILLDIESLLAESRFEMPDDTR